ncbi:MAG: Hpt domain-containing protein, partial [Chamaesiphon sp.]|nr:Hpt domain-containing protein [Chamaesiphon sp.]
MNPIEAAEAELQQELREMFTIDTQQHLEIYFSTIQQLNPRSWTADIQNLYRAIHTIKGGAVTVSADAMLQVAMVLEDLLSDLRYLAEAPILGDGELVQILIEAGELLSSSIEITETGDRAIEQVQPTVNRSIQLRDRVKQLYLPDWNELKQVHQEFAEQGFDLVILDLEMALARIPSLGLVPAQIIDAAEATLAQLTQIGVDIELARGWTILLEDCQELIAKPDCQLWRSVWFEYFQLLKACVKNSGEIAATDIERLAQLKSIVKSTDLDSVSSNIAADRELLDSIDIFFLAQESEPTVSQSGEIDRASNDLVDSLDNFFLDDAQVSAVSNDFIDILDDLFIDEVELISDLDLTPIPNTSISIEAFDEAATLIQPDSFQNESREIDLDFTVPTLAISQDVKAEIQPVFTSNYISSDLSDTFDVFDEFFGDTSAEKLRPDASELLPIVGSAEIESIADLPDLLDDFFNDVSIESDKPDVDAERSIASNAIKPSPILDSEVLPPIVAENTNANPVAIKRIQIPVPLERLDKSAQQVVETLLTARAVTSISTQLQSQLNQLTTLTRENSQFVTRLRQLQDDYALLRNL